MEDIHYPVRINKYLALKKFCSRKEADELIGQKKVSINGKLAILGAKVRAGDKITVENAKKSLLYLAYNKPKGIITHSPQEKEKSIKEITRIPRGVFPVGRLDKDSHGLIILTNDGRVTDKMLNPKYEHQKEYVVKTNRPVYDKFLDRMANGVRLDDGYVTKKCITKKLGQNIFSIILTEGKNRQIRRMCGVLGRQVLDLQRIRVLNIKLGQLKPGQYRNIIGKELSDFLHSLDLD